MSSCTHHWLVDQPSPGNPYVGQTCKRCGTTKTVPAYQDMTPTKPGAAQRRKR